jgi:hypothetical protein
MLEAVDALAASGRLHRRQQQVDQDRMIATTAQSL